MNFALQPKQIFDFIDKDICFIDIRDKEQYDAQHIRHFIHMPISSFDDSKLPKDKPIVMICYSGEQTRKLAYRLRVEGYQAYYIEGGFQAFLDMYHNQYF